MVNLTSIPKLGTKNCLFDRRKRRLTRRNAVLKGLSACTGRWGVSDAVNNPALALALARASEGPHRPVHAYSAVKLLCIPLYEIITSATS
jgi:hypothetical protein